MRGLTKTQDIKLQLSAGKTGGTNINKIQMSPENCETVLLSIPCRYMNSSTHEMTHKDDIESCENLIKKFIDILVLK